MTQRKGQHMAGLKDKQINSTPLPASIDAANNTAKRAPYKIELCLMELLARRESGLIELEALQAYGETCLHTTISTLSNAHALTFERGSHQHRSKRGPIAIFTRYSLVNDEQSDKAKALLKHYRTKRGLAA